MATLVAMATVHEKFQMTFPMKVLSQFSCNFIFSINIMVVQNLAKENYLLKFKMAAMPIYGKTLQTSSSPELLCQLGDILHEAYGAPYYIK